MNRSIFFTVTRVAFATVVLVIGSSATAQAPEANRGLPDWIDLYEPHDGGEVPYRLMKPLGFDPNKRYPVIVSLHGGAGRGTDNLKQLRIWNGSLAEEKLRLSYPSYVLVPQSTELWDAEDLSGIKKIVEALPSVDMDRIYVLGHSMGGYGTYIFLQLDPDYFAAAAPSGGTGLAREEPPDPSLITDIPIWAFHGDMDTIVPYDRALELFSEMKRLGANMKLTTWVGDDHRVSTTRLVAGGDNGRTQLSSERCDPEPDFMKWLFNQSRANRK